MLVSLIVPIYNVEEFLPRCLDSIIRQEYGNLEIILVNDGSTDQSGLICDRYAEKDERFIVIHKENGGVSSARNVGLNEVTGNYIGFIDPDDWIEPNMIIKLYELIVQYNADIAMCGYVKEDTQGLPLYKHDELSTKVLNKEETLNSILNPNGFRGFLWNKLFSADLFYEKQIFFDENICFCEDLLFCCQAILNAKQVVYDSTPYYHYIIHDSNASKSNFSLKKLTALDSLENIVKLLGDQKGVRLEQYKNYYMHLNISLLMNGIHDGKIRKQDKERLKKNLYKFRIGDLTSKFVKFSCGLARLNLSLYYFIWKNIKISK
ncbi:glycosyltransferase [Bacillus wiedmannii]|uniref:glycosyltransferase n=1 Tax=Bacillus wiedmannii TaxID=1890302 RepID=UPI001C03902A|nr:glycosyltransferase [Bacillus wiedmannii]QWI19513.1 glycosyltransferase [Bacillus wiedmannii]